MTDPSATDMSVQQVGVRLTELIPHANRVVADERFKQEPATNSHKHEHLLCLQGLHAVRVRCGIGVTRWELEGYESVFEFVIVPFDMMNIPIIALVLVAHAKSPKTLNDTFENGVHGINRHVNSEGERRRIK